MMTMLHFDAAKACVVLNVWGRSLNYQLRFDVVELARHPDDIIRCAAEAWRSEGSHTPTRAEFAVFQQAQERLLAEVRKNA